MTFLFQKRKKGFFYYLFFMNFFFLPFAFAKTIPLSVILKKVQTQNASLKAQVKVVDSRNFEKLSVLAPPSPWIGTKTLNRNMETHYVTLQQKLLFPFKYPVLFQEKNSQAHLAQAQKHLLWQNLRKQAIDLYYQIYTTQRILKYTQINYQLLKDISRIAESRYAAKLSSQSELRRAHLELTHVELTMLQLREKIYSLQQSLKTLWNEPQGPKLTFSNKELFIPIFKPKTSLSAQKLFALLRKWSPDYQVQKKHLDVQNIKTNLTLWDFGPDLQFRFEKRISGAPLDSNIFSFQLSIPLWFWGKTSTYHAQKAKSIQQEFLLDQLESDLSTRVQDLYRSIQIEKKSLKIYQTALIPQAEGAYRSTKAAYQARQAGFIDLLDTERLFYQVHVHFYQSLFRYVTYLSSIEKTLGTTWVQYTPLSKQ